ncbi:hypothetical protein J437_LFUL010235 [Ladona fulva]|uniref:CCZ1/INTU/HSP4 first Longin domain-containing protein n=1 Tax=Ladona fulva TaxID=123851 RepID=A0A8K0P3C6_LADFU|nr:hypothetical protein J437_LFUL010235 [Ladona fulva]
MAKDFNIVFVYDTQRCQREEDDPQDALLYFHPGWVSDQQRMALAGQLMGAAHFFLATFSCPKVLTLQRGKFVVRQFGRYILAVGTDSGTPDWLLQMQATSLETTIAFYHKDLETIAHNVAASLPSPGAGSDNQEDEASCSKLEQFDSMREIESEQRNALAERLTQMLDVYVPVLQCASSPFSHIPTVLLPKSASNTFLEAFQILQCCQAKKGVLGGILLYQNKVVATQLCSETTKRLVYTDPFRIKSPAESVCGAFRPPIGVQLLRIYVSSKELERLHSMAETAEEAFSSVSSLQPAPRKASISKTLPNKEQQTTSLKRDPSRILSVLEEGEGESDIWGEGPESPKVNGKQWIKRSPGPTSPSKVLLEQVISICKAGLTEMTNRSKMVVKDKKEEEEELSPIVTHPFYKERSHSLDDMKVRPFPMHHHAFGLSRHDVLNKGLGSPQKDEDEEELNASSWDGIKGKKMLAGRKVFQTITDPMYPVFRSDGLPISHALFNECLELHYQALKHGESETEKNRMRRISKQDPNKGEKKSVKLVDPGKPENMAQENRRPAELSPTGESIDRSKQELYRRSLSLPLKSFALDGESSGEAEDGAMKRRARAASECPGFVPTPGPEQTPLSPLLLPPGVPIPFTMERFSRDVGSESSKETESTNKVTNTSLSLGTVPEGAVIEKGGKGSSLTNGDELQDVKLEPAVLYVYGQHDMSLMLIMDDGCESDPELVHGLFYYWQWEMCEEGLGGLEAQLARCLEHHQTVGGASGGGIGVGEVGFSSGLGVAEVGEGGSYGFLSFDPFGETLQCGGSRPWGAPEAEVAQQLHAHFRSIPGLTEVVVRCEDYTVYGCQCCRSEVFYQQPAGNKAGLPAPSDLMGVVPLKARRRLERDYGIVLL